MSELDSALVELKKTYKVIDVFYYSTLASKNGEKTLYDWLYQNRKNHFDATERLVFLQDCNDVYEYNIELGDYTKIIQTALQVVDISNCFITILTTNPNINNELTVASPGDLINYVIVDGDYTPNIPIFKDTFCVMPWTHLHINPDGNVLPCCAGDTKYPMGNINQDSIETIYNNSNFQRLRKELMSGRHAKECKYCWVHEKDNLTSFRIDNNKLYHVDNPSPDGLVNNVAPITFDVRLNKLCNLKCRSCSPHLSSSIAQEVKSIYNVDWPLLNNTQRKAALPELLELLPNAKNMYLGGGEPLLTPEHFEILNELIKINNTDATLFYNTNFMQLDFRGISFPELWGQFSDVTVGASLDAHGTVAEYLRHGTVWSTIESNLLRLKNEAPHVKFIVTSTVGFLNVESLIELQKDWTERNLIDINQFQIPQIIYDSFFSVQVAPIHHKRRLESIILNHINWLNSINASALVKNWQQIIAYMWEADRTHLLPEFQRTMRNQDNYRNESFHKILPQFADLIPEVE